MRLKTERIHEKQEIVLKGNRFSEMKINLVEDTNNLQIKALCMCLSALIR